jgi:putative membrane protein
MHHTNEQNGSDILKGLAAGLIGGLVGTIVMTQYQNIVTQIGKSANGDDKKKEEKEGGENATVKTAKAISENVFDHKLKKSEKEQAGNAVHYVFGTTVGALYGAAAEAIPATAMGYGLPFGTALFIGADEVAVPALGLSEPPTEIPMTTHAYALSSHLVYGLTADLVRRAVRKYI